MIDWEMDPKKRSLYSLEQDEEEDEWEREASSSSVIHHTKPPNSFAVDSDILDNQYHLINTSCNEQTDQLARLKQQLATLEKEEALQKTNTDEAKEQYLKSLETTVNMLETNTTKPFLETDHVLSNTLSTRLDQWQQSFKDTPHEETEGWERAYRTTEFDLIDLNAQIQGHHARMRQLRTDQARLNQLPKLVPLLQSETDQFAQEMQLTSKELEQLETDAIRPSLQRLIQTEVKRRQQQILDHECHRIQSLSQDLDRMVSIVKKQRACQQWMIYTSHDSWIRQIVQAIQKELDTLVEPWSEPISPLQFSDPIGLLHPPEKELERNWMDQMTSYMTTAKALHQTKQRLSDSLLAYSNTTDSVVMTPKSYTNLQNEFEFRTHELKLAMSELEKQMKDTLTFEQQKKLFSLFFTDPDRFEEMHSELISH
ncbi:hypothetical protein BD560DRAFT_387769 [Blakeslea trispora]|nr:hypothetical protein BD560DRAFT_387769 [Blakeslea trispora]